jgi:hypothetical protein
LKKILDRDDAFPFSISLDDPTGNSWIAPNTTDRGNKYTRREYPRTHEQNEELGISADSEAINAEKPQLDAGDLEDLDIVDGQVYTIPAECPGCNKACKGKIHTYCCYGITSANRYCDQSTLRKSTFPTLRRCSFGVPTAMALMRLSRLVRFLTRAVATEAVKSEPEVPFLRRASALLSALRTMSICLAIF